MSGQMCLALLVVTVTLFHQCQGHGYLLDPPGRSSMWRVGAFKGLVIPNYNDMGLRCGGSRVRSTLCLCFISVNVRSTLFVCFILVNIRSTIYLWFNHGYVRCNYVYVLIHSCKCKLYNIFVVLQFFQCKIYKTSVLQSCLDNQNLLSEYIVHKL